MIRFEEEIDQKIFRYLYANPMVESQDNVSISLYMENPPFVLISADLYSPVDYGEGYNLVMLERQFVKIPGLVKLFDLSGRDDLTNIKKLQLWNMFLCGECQIVCIVNGCHYWFNLIGGLGGNTLEFRREDSAFIPLVLPREQFGKISSYWEYAWDFHLRNPYTLTFDLPD